MPVTRPGERNSLSLDKSYTLSTQDEESNGNNPINGRLLDQRRGSDSPRKMNVQSRYLSSTSAVSTYRRSATNDGIKQQSGMSGSGSDKSSGHHAQQQQCQSAPPPKPKCGLPTTVCQPGYVTPSKLFNIMGYGLQNHYLFMHAHYLYIIDCRSREKFNESHIITGKNLLFFHLI
jgi:hypothetical protein